MTCFIMTPVSLTSSTPLLTRPEDSAISWEISFAALALRWARLRTSPATTAKPRPCSPARAASTAAFSARILVWKAIPSTMLLISPILRALSSISPITTTTSLTSVSPCPARVAARSVRVVALCALSALFFTVTEISSMLAAVSTIAAACSSVREARSRLPAEISLVPP